MNTTTTTKKTAPTLTKDQVTKLAGMTTTSSKIRYLNSTGMTRADIARTLDKRYQHVKNVLDKPLKSQD